MIELYVDKDESRQVLIYEYDGPPPKNAKQEKAVFRNTLAWGGYQTDDRGSTTARGPWVLRFDSNNPKDVKELQLLKDRLAMTKDDGSPLMPNIQPFTPNVRPEEVNAEVERQVAERLKVERERLEAEFLHKQQTIAAGQSSSPFTSLTSTGTVGGSTSYSQSGTKQPQTRIKPVNYWTCPACTKVVDLRGKSGHVSALANRGSAEHDELWRMWKQAKQNVAVGIA